MVSFDAIYLHVIVVSDRHSSSPNFRCLLCVISWSTPKGRYLSASRNVTQVPPTANSVSSSSVYTEISLVCNASASVLLRPPPWTLYIFTMLGPGFGPHSWHRLLLSLNLGSCAFLTCGHCSTEVAEIRCGLHAGVQLGHRFVAAALLLKSAFSFPVRLTRVRPPIGMYLHPAEYLANWSYTLLEVLSGLVFFFNAELGLLYLSLL